MGYTRREKILEIINEEEIYTQQQLAQRLNELGFKLTQATVSREINEMGLIKKVGKNGKSCYASAPIQKDHLNNRLTQILRQTVQEIKSSENIIVLKTLNGCANAAAEALDCMDKSHIIGSIAGDNTIFAVVDSKDNVQIVLDELLEVIKNN